MRGSERVIDVIVGQPGELFSELLVVGFLLCVEPQILQQQRLPFFKFAGHLLGFNADAIGTETHVFPAPQFFVDQHAQPLGDGFQAHLWIRLAFWTSKV